MPAAQPSNGDRVVLHGLRQPSNGDSTVTASPTTPAPSIASAATLVVMTLMRMPRHRTPHTATATTTIGTRTSASGMTSADTRRTKTAKEAWMTVLVSISPTFLALLRKLFANLSTGVSVPALQPGATPRYHGNYKGRHDKNG